MLPLVALFLSAAPIQCPEGVTLKHDASSSSEWFICEKNGKREGPFAFVSSGHVALRATYRNDLLEGEQLGLREDGSIGSRTQFRAGEKHGLDELWYLSGQKMYEQEYQHGKPHGVLRRWREDGRLVVESFWLNGEPQRYTAYFPGGQKRFTATSPLPNTTVYEWDEQGALLREVKLVDGLEPSDPIDGSDDGNLSCPKEKMADARALGVGWPEDTCGGYPTFNPKTNRMQTFAWAPRKARAALKELGCEFEPTRPIEDVERMLWQSYFHSKASVGE